MKNEKAMFALSYGLFVLTARQGEKDNGCIINTAMQVTASPNRITIAVNKSNYTHDMVLATGKFTLSVLSEAAEFSIFQRFGFQSGRDVDKFDGFLEHTARGENGILRVTQGTSAWLSCQVVSTLDLGTHTLFLADVVDGDVLSQVPSTTYTYYQANIKPKPQAAPPSDKKRWVCTVCGYVYEGEELPADFICPLCKHPASDFELLP
jgi:flavin reductase (DIM6/NTAB) family NADH-FMN oxidoreductase RutF